MPADQKPVLRLVIQASVPVLDVASGTAFYDRLKSLLTSESSASTCNGQLIQFLESCCGDKAPRVPGSVLPYHGPSPFAFPR